MKLSILFLTAVVFLSGLPVKAASSAPSVLPNILEDELTFMKSVYRYSYAPMAWKKNYAAWDLETEINKSIFATRSSANLDMKAARHILKDFIYSMKDYHVSIGFQLTEAASLPLVIKGVNDKYFLAYIDRSKLPESSFPFHVGDQVISFGGQIPAQAVSEVQGEFPANIPETDHARAELALTSRTAARGYNVPSGPITLEIKPQGSVKVFSHQLIWDYIPEKVADPQFTIINQLFGTDEMPKMNPHTDSFFNPHMDIDLSGANAETPYDMGARKTFTPDLGKKIWETDKDDPFYAYMYRSEDRKIIGYVRIPSYSPENIEKALASFSKIIANFEGVTDALVIDQVNNPGGSVFYLYTLASMLSDQPLYTPQHEMAISPEEVKQAIDILPKLEAIKNDEQAKKELGPTLSGYPVSYEIAKFYLNYARFVISEWNAGRHLTQPYWIVGVDKINPNPIHYSKPILLLINNLDFSGGDFFPAIMQDNKRVTIMGSRTAGAGGYVHDVTFPNSLGIQRFRVTGSIAKRINTHPIENLGVEPDVTLTVTENDLVHNYVDYIKAVQTEVQKISK